MTRQLEILMNVANVVFDSLGLNLSEFEIQLTPEKQYLLHWRNTLPTIEEAQAKIKLIIVKLPINMRGLIDARESVKGGYTAIMSIRILWEIIAKKIPGVLMFVTSERNKINSSDFIYFSEFASRLHGRNVQGLEFKHYGWVCSRKDHENIFSNMAMEVQTLVWAMYATGCFYMNIKFDAEPAKFKGAVPPSPAQLEMFCQQYTHSTPVPWRLVI